MKNVLIVDDDPDISDTMKMIIESAGYTVSLAPNADQALANLSARTYDLVILDIMMPGMKVEDFMDIMNDTPVVYCSALTKSEAAKSVPLGAPNVKGYIHKPFDVDEFLEVIGSA